MYASKYNLVFDIPNKEKMIFNPLSGAIDIIDEIELKALNNLKHGNIDTKYLNDFISRGYIFQSKEDEDKELERIYHKFENASKDNANRFILCPTYDCNLRCTYCYQDKSMRKTEIINDKVLSKFFETVENIHNSNSSPYISLFGGEPLMKQYSDTIEKIIKLCEDRSWKMLAVTNGVDLEYYSDILNNDIFKQIQVTIDGPKEIHDKRRIFPDSSGSFDRIVGGIDKILDKVPIVLRVNVDNQNIDSLPKLADFIIEKGWNGKIHSYISPVKSLVNISGMDYSYCMPEYKILENVFDIYKEHEQTKIFRLEGWQGVDSILRLLEKNSLFPPQFKNCEANVDMLAFDLYGDVYTCLEGVGKKIFSIGKFYPEVEFNENLKEWRNRSIFTIPECKECNVNILCGGGCSVLALDKNNSLYSNYCKPVKKALELAIPFYYEELKAIGDKN